MAYISLLGFKFILNRSLFMARILTIACLPFAVVGTVLPVARAAEEGSGWIITKDQWTATDEKNFSDFVSAIGNSRCNTIDSCIRNPANPYRATDPSGVKFWSDCAKFPYFLRAYFAWKNSLPFGYVNNVVAAEGRGADLRYSPKGNLATARRDIVMPSPVPLNGFSTLNKLLSEVNSAMFRFDPRVDVKGKLGFDFYSVKVSRETIRSGTLIYDPNGHVAVIYKIENDGRIRFIDAHPDNSVSRGVYGEKFARSSPGMGAGFKNFRPLQLVGATRAAGGLLVGGQIVLTPNLNLPGYSTEQYFGTDPAPNGFWKNGKFLIGGTERTYYDFVRTRMAVGDLKYHPVEEMVYGMDALCQDLQDRAEAVKGALLAGIQRKPQPDRLPMNIYGTSGEWETYSTPSRDARLKTSFRELRQNVEQFIDLQKLGSPRIDYKGANLVADLRSAYAQAAKSCVITYSRSDGSPVKIDFDEITKRLFALSFDPYQCVELRWGAYETSELVTCTDDSVKRNWYTAEQGLRNQLDRTYDTKMGFSLDQLRAGGPGTGVKQGPDVDLRDFLNKL